jgi:uncharacterized membrane protein
MNLRRYLPKDNETILLWLIIISGFILRAWRMNFQSYWLDELHTMNESDPSITWAAMFNYLKCCDPHPPLYFIVCRFAFALFGHTEYVGRLVSVLFGTAGIWAMYFLGREIINRRLGLLAAALTSFNYFLILYSQETRNYIVVFFFTALSLGYLFRLLKNLRRNDMIGFAVCTLLMLYSHYYGLFIAFAEYVVALIFIIVDKPNRKMLFKWFGIAGIIIAIGYAPWLPYFFAISQIQSFWIGQISPDFAKVFFSEYFSDSPLVLPFVILLLIYYCIEVFRNDVQEPGVRSSRHYNPLALSFIVLFTTMVLAYLVPYLRSLLVIPMLFNRYTIVVVPVFIMGVAFGLERIRNYIVRFLLLITMLILSFIDLTLVRHFYTLARKTQFREINSFIITTAKQEGKAYPIINQGTSWQQQYYIKHWKYPAPILSGKKEDIVDSILRKASPKYNLDGFWIVGFHGEARLSDEKKAALDTAYVLMRDSSGIDAWCEQYISQNAAGGSRIISAGNFDAKFTTNMDGHMVIPVWGGTVLSNPVKFKKGTFEMAVTSKGTPFDTTYPHLKIYLNDQLVDEFYTQENYLQHKAKVTIPNDGDYVLKIEMDNDASAPGRGDRNAFVQRIFFKKEQ